MATLPLVQNHSVLRLLLLLLLPSMRPLALDPQPVDRWLSCRQKRHPRSAGTRRLHEEAHVGILRPRSRTGLPINFG